MTRHRRLSISTSENGLTGRETAPLEAATDPDVDDGPDENLQTVTFTLSEWKHDPISEAFGIRKAVPKTKEPTPGVKSVLIYHDSFVRAKKHMRGYKQLHPVVDLPEVISAMIDVCDADPDLWPRITHAILTRRERQNAHLRAIVLEQERQRLDSRTSSPHATDTNAELADEHDNATPHAT
jgi:hypothetical protein